MDLEKHARGAVTRLVRLLRIEKQGLWVVLVYSIGVGLASLAAPIGVQMLVSAIAFGGLVQPIVVLSLLVLVALAFAAVLHAAQTWVVERIQQRLFVRVAADLAQRLSQVSISAFDGGHGPERVNRFFDVLTLQKGAAMLLLDGIFVTLQVIVGGVLLAFYHPALLAFAVVLLASMITILFAFGSKGATTSIKESKSKYALVAWFEEMARHPTIFRGRGGARFATHRSEELTQQYVEYRQAHFKVLFRQIIALVALEAVATAALLGIGGFLVLGGALTLGQLVAAELIVSGVVAGFSKFGKYLEIYYDLIAAMDKLGDLVEMPLERDGGATAPLAARAPLGLRVVDATLTFHGKGGISNVSLDVPPGAHIALVGPNGSGKSTLVDVIYGLRDPLRGHVEIDGLPLRELSLRELRDQIALVRGAPIFDGTIATNVSLDRPEVTVEDIRRALTAVGLWDEISRMPEGLHTHVTTNGENLSAGQAHRLAIARAIAGKPRCLLLDETLDSLDPQAKRIVLKNVLGPEFDCTVVVATHEPDVAAACIAKYEMGMS